VCYTRNTELQKEFISGNQIIKDQQEHQLLISSDIHATIAV